jgi:hypothetical protein
MHGVLLEDGRIKFTLTTVPIILIKVQPDHPELGPPGFGYETEEEKRKRP